MVGQTCQSDRWRAQSPEMLWPPIHMGTRPTQNSPTETTRPP